MDLENCEIPREKENALNPRLSILFGCPYFFPAIKYGGPVVSQYQLAIRLAARGHFVRAITTGVGVPKNIPRDCWHRWPEGVEVWYALENRFNAFAPHINTCLSPPFNEALRACSVMHLNVGYTHLNIVGHRRAKRFGVPYILTPHGVYGAHHRSVRRWRKRAFHVLLEKRVLRDARFVHVLVPEEAHDTRLAGVPGERIRMVPNGADFAAFAHTENETGPRKSLGLPDESKIILSLARLHPSKGPDMLIEAFNTARSHLSSQWHLVLAGPDHGMMARCEKLASVYGLTSRVHLPGGVYGPQKYRWLQDANIFSLPSWAEGMPNGVLEACAAGTPVLITDRCHLPEVSRWQAGVITTPHVSDLAQGLLTLNKMDLKKLGRNGKKMVAELFTWDSVVDRMEKLYYESQARG